MESQIPTETSEKTLINDVIIKKIGTKLRDIIRINFQKYLRQETLETFQENCCKNIGNDLKTHV